MTPKYSLVHLTDADCPPPDFIRLAAKARFDCVSLRSIPTRMHREEKSVGENITGKMPFALSENPALLRETRRAAKTEGIEIHDTENARIFDGVNVQDYEKDLEAAAELGIHHILTNIWTEDAMFYEDAFGRLCDLGAQYDLSVNLEFVTWSGVKDLNAASELLRRVNRPNQGIVLDTLHFYRSGNTVKDLEGLPKEWFRYVHLCDCPAEIPMEREELIRTGLEERMIPGSGAVDMRAILKQIPHVVRGIEIPNRRMTEQMRMEAYLTKALADTKKYLDDSE